MMDDDRQLLRQFTQHNSQEAFAALTTRYLSLVYSTCRRELKDANLAEDVTQAVFLILARKAPSLRREVVLSGWLFQTARFAARNARLQETRRKAYEQKAAEARMEQQMETEDAAWKNDSQWKEIEPLLNQSLAALRDGERDCVLLRFFQGMSFAEAGAALGLSEEAARKRMTRALDKMRQIFVKNGVIVPSAALAVLLTTHAAKTAPIGLATAIAKSTSGVLAGHINAALTSTHAYQLSEGILKAMKIVQIKTAACIAVILIIGGATYTLVNADSAGSVQQKAVLDETVPVPGGKLSAGGEKDADRNVVLTGKVRYENGRPAGGVQIAAQIQLKASEKQDELLMKQIGVKNGQSQTVTYPPRYQKWSWNNTVSKPDGSYDLPVGPDIAYNVMVFDNTGKWVAAGAEGISGAINTVVKVPDLVLTRGSLVVGRVTTPLEIPIPHWAVQSYGPHRPETTAATSSVFTDLSGHYRMRVAPGTSRIYASLNKSENGSKTLNIERGEIVTANFQINPVSSL